MSDTPISDSTPHNVADLGMLCRRLERELNAANERIKNLESALCTVENIDKVNAYQDLESANERIKRLEEALHRIANTDYRGNRSTESQIAFEALTEAKP